MNDQEKSIKAGKHKNFLAETKSAYPDKYRLIEKYGIEEYEEKCIELRNGLSNIIFDLADKRKIKDFFIKDVSDIFKSYNSFYGWLYSASFSVSISMSYFTFSRSTEILKRYNKYIN
jgi:hypothetical protein